VSGAAAKEQLSGWSAFLRASSSGAASAV
jgi:hypothetical protein